MKKATYIDDWSGPSRTIVAGGKSFFFEWHGYCGPTILHRHTHDPLDKQPGPRSPFWDAVTLWDRRGRRMKDGLCVWDEQKPETFRVLKTGKKSYLVLEPDSPYVEGETTITRKPPLFPHTPPAPPTRVRDGAGAGGEAASNNPQLCRSISLPSVFEAPPTPLAGRTAHPHLGGGASATLGEGADDAR